MNKEEEKAFHRGKDAARFNAGEMHPSERRTCEFRRGDLRAAWRKGYEEQEAQQSPRVPRTPEQEAAAQNLVSALQAWVRKN